MNLDYNQKIFFELLRAGLWGDQRSAQEFNVQEFKDVDWEKVYELAEEQSVQGLVLQGIEWFKNLDVDLNLNVNIPELLLLEWIADVKSTEQENKDMNAFIADLIGKLRKNDVYALLVKGQGIAQCYEKPLWRPCGDVDLLLGAPNYEKAKEVLLPLATDVEQEYTHIKHLGMTLDGWLVELHGTLHTRLSGRMDSVIDEVQKDAFCGGNERSVEFKGARGQDVQVFLPAANEDVIFVFTHILHHFFIEGVVLRQICDWCKLLWTYRESLNHEYLESRIREMGLMTEWKAFGTLAIEYLGMPAEAMPLVQFRDESLEFRARHKDKAYRRYKKKADRIMAFVLEVGSNERNKEADGEGVVVHSYFVRKLLSFWARMKVMWKHFRIFPSDSFRFLGGLLRSGLHAVARGE